MSKLAMHVEHYKRGSVGAIDQHNLRTGETHSNEDIDPERSDQNIQLLSPEGSLYSVVKEEAASAAGRVTANSVLVSEWIVYPEEGLQDPFTADPEKLKDWGNDVLDWMKAKGILSKSATIHMDETTVHMHVDTIPKTADGRLSRKEIYTRQALSEFHTELANYLAEKGWDIQRGSTRKKGQKGKAKTVREYKEWAEEEKARIDQELTVAQEAIEGIQVKKEEAEQDLQKAQEQYDQKVIEARQVAEVIAKQHEAVKENDETLAAIEADIREAEDWIRSNPSLAQQTARAEELRRLRAYQAETEKKLKAYEQLVKDQEKAIECLREDLQSRMASYIDLKERKKEAWAKLSDAESTVAMLQDVLDDSGIVKGLIVRIALCGAQSHADAAKKKHDALCAAVRAERHKIQAEQEKLKKQSADLDELLQEGAKAAITPRVMEQGRGKGRDR